MLSDKLTIRHDNEEAKAGLIDMFLLTLEGASELQTMVKF